MFERKYSIGNRQSSVLTRFLIIKSLRTEQAAEIIIKCFPYYLGVNCEAFILCYTGEYLASKVRSEIEKVKNSHT